MSFLKEFKEFARRGNVMDLAVGMIIGSAFTAIVKSLVDNILGPILGLLTAGIDLSNFKLIISGEGEKAVKMDIGLFIQSVISFVLVAFAVFCLVKAIRSFEKKEEEKPSEPTPPPRQESLLEEIRDLLKEK